eukprot:CAMPEP_0119288414 /NCGR_PEP_ID=MMETSP1329-20130426/37225_1 /TAXON_ID=114041 /ORGANISM="Genus nov. species nov., Strain RCC1024" /LENGTH=47 /DNA_ID= /DNA_START= /DNA_END= /DNA_ORIENTATION=
MGSDGGRGARAPVQRAEQTTPSLVASLPDVLLARVLEALLQDSTPEL